MTRISLPTGCCSSWGLLLAVALLGTIHSDAVAQAPAADTPNLVGHPDPV